jgi:DNA-binding GntR family transcriptional regulator
VALPRVDRRMLWQDTIVPLRSAILAGQLAPGDRLVEADLAAQMGVSRGPVRESLQQLEREGLVETTPTGRTVVRGITEQDVLDLLTLRQMLEAAAARAAASRVAPDDVALWRGLLAEREGGAVEDPAGRAATSDAQFHAHVFAVARNRPLRRAWDGISSMVEALCAAADASREPGALSADRRMVDALVRGDAEAAVTALGERLLGDRQRMLGWLRGDSAVASGGEAAAPAPVASPRRRRGGRVKGDT